MPAAFRRQRVGEIRPSQVIHTFGVGSLVDLPHFSAIVLGLDDWEQPSPYDVVVEERLLALVRSHLGPQVERLVAPPRRADDRGSLDPFDPETLRGIPVSPFPQWMRCPSCNLVAPLDFGLFQLKPDPWRPDRTAYVHQSCQAKRTGRPPELVPVRFLRACEHGHLDDFPWVEFVHGGPTDCPSLLRLHEFGVSAETADIVVQCDQCGRSRNLVTAFTDENDKKLVAHCTGRHPHLRHRAECSASAKAILAGASNLWFSVTISSLAMPSATGVLAQLVVEHWPKLEPITSLEILAAFSAAGHLQAFASWSNDELWAAIESKRNRPREEGPRRVSELKQAEWEVFAACDVSKNGTDFELAQEAPPRGYENWIEKVVRVERLRTVQAQIGFTRILSPGDFADVSELPEIRRAPLARRPPTWVPASEVRGEGIFLQFREEAIAAWLEHPTIRRRGSSFLEAHTAFRRARRITPPEANFPGTRYVLLHSLAHVLIRQFSIECGYGAASIQERVYARDGGGAEPPMAGILLYTAAADSEGTLGGLVNLGRPAELGRHLDQALEGVRLCASDPLCSEHGPGDAGAALHGAACHACLFAAETSCERGNKYLDRALLVPTVGGITEPFFGGAPGDA